MSKLRFAVGATLGVAGMALVAGLLGAANPSEFRHWTAAAMKPVTASEKLEDFGNHSARVTVRDKDGLVEVHDDWTDIMIIESGQATISIGGTLVDPKSTGPGETRANTATGAKQMPVVPGDIIHVPAGTPHQFLMPAGNRIVYMAFKVPGK